MLKNIKVQLHCHSNRSHDGTLSPIELIDAYRNAGYGCIAITDHEGDYDESEKIASPYDDFIVLNGIEKGRWGAQTLVIEDKLFIAAHPQKKRFSWELEDFKGSKINLIECYNGRENKFYYDITEKVGEKYGINDIVVDDAHNKEGIDKAYTTVKISKLSKEAILNAILKGNYKNIIS
jgi:predicted metal-dependent phosphoesterase TrpH